MRNTRTFIHEANKIDLVINKEKTKVMETLAAGGGKTLTVDNYVLRKPKASST